MEMQLAWSGSKTRFSGSHSSRSVFSLACKMIPFERLNSVSQSWQLLLSGARHSGHLLRPSHNNRMRELVHRFRQLHDSWFSATFLFWKVHQILIFQTRLGNHSVNVWGGIVRQKTQAC